MPDCPGTLIHHCPSLHFFPLSLFHLAHSIVRGLFIFLLLPLIPHRSRHHSLSCAEPPSLSFLPSPPFKFPRRRGLSYFSINVTTSSLLFSAIAPPLPLHCHLFLSLPSSLCQPPPPTGFLLVHTYSDKIKHATSALSLCVLYKATVVIIKQEHLKTLAHSI